MKEFATALTAFLVMGIVIAAATMWFDAVRCHASWEASGMKAEWTITGRCRVQRKDGTWVPSSVIREMTP